MQVENTHRVSEPRGSSEFRAVTTGFKAQYTVALGAPRRLAFPSPRQSFSFSLTYLEVVGRSRATSRRTSPPIRHQYFAIVRNQRWPIDRA